MFLVMTLMKDKLNFIQPCNATYGLVKLVNGPLTSKSQLQNVAIPVMTICDKICRIDSLSLGTNKSLNAHSCNHIKTTGCSSKQPSSGVYWVWREQPMQV